MQEQNDQLQTDSTQKCDASKVTSEFTNFTQKRAQIASQKRVYLVCWS